MSEYTASCTTSWRQIANRGHWPPHHLGPTFCGMICRSCLCLCWSVCKAGFPKGGKGAAENGDMPGRSLETQEVLSEMTQ